MNAPFLPAREGAWGLRELVGQRLGDFESVRELGRGGMGVVYEAPQLSPIDDPSWLPWVPVKNEGGGLIPGVPLTKIVVIGPLPSHNSHGTRLP